MKLLMANLLVYNWWQLNDPSHSSCRVHEPQRRQDILSCLIYLSGALADGRRNAAAADELPVALAHSIQLHNLTNYVGVDVIRENR